MSGVLRSAEYRLAARHVLRWTAWYTRGLDPAVAGARQDEIASDLYEHARWAEEAGVDADELARSIRGRALRGVPADLAWRAGALQRVDPRLRSARRAEASLRSLVATIGIVDAALGAFVAVRVVRALLIGDVAQVPGPAIGAIALGTIALIATFALSGPRQRGWAALLLAVPTTLIFAQTALALYFLSATAVLLVNRVSWWQPAALAVGLALAAVCVTAAVHWLRPTRGAARDIRADASTPNEGVPHA
ncbi:hypothetical protein M3147_16340 [Agromyces mediolanus]|uniref:hypothetical protein n=1 Tax=Agromyces mediolanus TaxID=41986 RepID=UPI00203AE8F8|nr:hypothetical protein [Agromyces mediolanus]MCM3658827.1 hypothetical protein [Agromyces mediolanus]